jgi:hypothetical protein
MPWNIIPQIFYDLIARVTPGAIILIIGYLTFSGPGKAIKNIISASSKLNIFNFGMFVLGFILSYILGTILYELWAITFKKAQEKWSEEKIRNTIDLAIDYHNKMRDVLGVKPLKVTKDDLPRYHIMHDHLRRNSEAEAYRLLKLRAEQRLGQVLFMGFFLLSIINVGYWISEVKLLVIDRAFLEVFLFLAMYLFWRQSERRRRFYIHGTCTQWLFSNFPIEPRKAETQDKKSQNEKNQEKNSQEVEHQRKESQ